MYLRKGEAVIKFSLVIGQTEPFTRDSFFGLGDMSYVNLPPLDFWCGFSCFVTSSVCGNSDSNAERCFTEKLLMQKCLFSWLSFRTSLDSHGAQDIRILGSGNHFLLKVNGYSFRGSNSDFHFYIPFQRGTTLKENNLLLLEQILPFES